MRRNIGMLSYIGGRAVDTSVSYEVKQSKQGQDFVMVDVSNEADASSYSFWVPTKERETAILSRIRKMGDF